LVVLDEGTRECLATEVDSSLGGQRVVRVLNRIASERGYPKEILSDNGPEFASIALSQWAYEHRVMQLFIDPGKPMQNGYVEMNTGLGELLKPDGLLSNGEPTTIQSGPIVLWIIKHRLNLLPLWHLQPMSVTPHKRIFSQFPWYSLRGRSTEIFRGCY